MTQIHGSGAGAWSNIATVDSNGRLWVSAQIIGSMTVNSLADQYIQRIDYSGGTLPIYIGLAGPGAGVDEAKWQIKQLSYDANSLVSGILFASGNLNFDKHWINRYSGAYS